MFLFIIAIYVHLPHPALNVSSEHTLAYTRISRSVCAAVVFGIDECVWNEGTKMNPINVSYSLLWQCVHIVKTAGWMTVIALRCKLVNFGLCMGRAYLSLPMNDANASNDLCIINIIINANDFASFRSRSRLRTAGTIGEGERIHISMPINKTHRKQETRVFRIYDKFLDFC